MFKKITLFIFNNELNSNCIDCKIINKYYKMNHPSNCKCNDCIINKKKMSSFKHSKFN